jgi:hypothetical protein
MALLPEMSTVAQGFFALHKAVATPSCELSRTLAFALSAQARAQPKVVSIRFMVTTGMALN